MPIRTLDLPALQRRVQAAAASTSGATVTELLPLHGGASSLTFTASMQIEGTSSEIAVKVAPPGVAPVLNRDVLRQARVLRALASVPDVRVPEILFEDAGEPPDRPPFFAMSFIEGQSFEPALPEPGETPAESVLGARVLAAASMLGSLHRSRPSALGLVETTTTLTEEVGRWARLFETLSSEFTAPAAEAACGLVRSIPAEEQPVIVHGDFRLGNLLCDEAGVRAIIDWEIWTVGDPRLDLSWFLMYLDSSRLPFATAAPALPTPGDVVAAYAASRGDLPRDLEWFDVFSRYKRSAIAAQLSKHANRRGDAGSPRERLERTAAQALLGQVLGELH
jgi:aminoglycoside phosphotransferase (APT) family kinase protein